MQLSPQVSQSPPVHHIRRISAQYMNPVALLKIPTRVHQKRIFFFMGTISHLDILHGQWPICPALFDFQVLSF